MEGVVDQKHDIEGLENCKEHKEGRQALRGWWLSVMLDEEQVAAIQEGAEVGYLMLQLGSRLSDGELKGGRAFNRSREGSLGFVDKLDLVLLLSNLRFHVLMTTHA